MLYSLCYQEKFWLSLHCLKGVVCPGLRWVALDSVCHSSLGWGQPSAYNRSYSVHHYPQTSGEVVDYQKEDKELHLVPVRLMSKLSVTGRNPEVSITGNREGSRARP